MMTDPSTRSPGGTPADRTVGAELAALRRRVVELERELEGERRAASAFRSAARNSRDRVAILDLDLRIRSINRLTSPLRQEDVLGKSILDYIDAAIRPEARRTFEEVARTRETGWFESESRTETEEHYWEVAIGPIVAGDELTGYTLEARDITEQSRERAAQNRFFLLSLDMLCVASFEGYFTRVNPAFSRILGYTTDELSSRPILSFVHPDDQARTIGAFETLFDGEAVIDFENRYCLADGSVRWISWRATSDLARREIYAVARDVTEQKSLAAQLRQAQRLETVGQVAGGIAHDFRNMVLAIETHLRMLRSGELTGPEREESIGRIEAATARARDLSRQLLSLAEVGTSVSEVFDVAHRTRQVLDLMGRLVPRDISVSIRVDPDAVTRVTGDPGQWEQVVLNLLLNARDALPDGGAVDIHLRRSPESCADDPWLRIDVRDDGIGMPEEVRARVFEPLFTTKGVGKGTGLGLSTVASIVAGHGGRVAVASREGEGATFSVDLPAGVDRNVLPPSTGADPAARTFREVPASSRASPAEAGAAARKGTELRGTETLLVAEDEELVREVLARVLGHAGYRVLFAENGEEALQVIGRPEAGVDLVILDHIMPRRTGGEVLEALRAAGSTVPVLIASGARRDPTNLGLSVEPDGYLQKPFEPPELLSWVRKLLDQRRAEGGTPPDPDDASSSASEDAGDGSDARPDRPTGS